MKMEMKVQIIFSKADVKLNGAIKFRKYLK